MWPRITAEMTPQTPEHTNTYREGLRLQMKRQQETLSMSEER